MEPQRFSRVVVVGAEELVVHLDFKAELFQDLPLERDFQRLAGLDLATGKLDSEARSHPTDVPVVAP